MGNDDHGRSRSVEDIFQPADGVDIKVVGRLIQQQNLRIGKQRLRQQYPQLEAGSDVLIGPWCCVYRMPTPSSNSPARASAE